jgi:membrane-bound inhibitor of C-type lysozyme
MKYEIVESENVPDHWHVEIFDDEGCALKAVFSGPGAKERATEYWLWKNGASE